MLPLRAQGIDYGHFCNHVREPGSGCTKCKRCFLWEDVRYFDAKKLKDIEKLAEEDQRIDDKHAGGLKVEDPPAPPAAVPPPVPGVGQPMGPPPQPPQRVGVRPPGLQDEREGAIARDG